MIPTRLLLLGGLLVALLAFSLPGRAQYVLTGAPSAAYHDLSPDKVVTALRTGPNYAYDSLDLDQDGRYDVLFTAYANSSNFPTDAEARVKPLHDDISIYTSIQTPFIVRFDSGDTIQQRIRQPNPSVSSQMWANRSTIYPYGSSFLARVASNPAGGGTYGYWTPMGADGYIAVRLISNSVTQLGWIRVQVTNAGTTQMAMTVKDFSLTSVVLAQTPARAAGWQVYPVPTTNSLTLKGSTPTTGQLEVVDTCGRVLLTAPVSGAAQQVDLSALAAGMYTLRVTAASGSFTQRISKL
jgi:hypothetical protein